MSGIHRSPRRGAPHSAMVEPRLATRLPGDSSGLSPVEIFANPGLLKIELMVRGISLAPELRMLARADEAYRNYFANTRDIEILLPEGTRVTAPVGPSPYLLYIHDSGFRLAVRHDHASLWPADVPLPDPVTVSFDPPSEFYTRYSKRGLALSRIGTIRGSYLACSPTSTCSFLGASDQCSFCSLAEIPAPGPPGSSDAIDVQDVLEAVAVARETDGIEVVYLSTGYADRPDSGVLDLDPYIRAIKHRFDVLVAVDLLPPKEDSWVDRTYAMGADAVSYNLEIYDPLLFEQTCPGPSRVLGRERFLDALAYAAGIFPAGAAICHLMVGMEPLESTAKGVEDLCAAGIVPVLPLFRPFKGIDMRMQPERAAKVCARLQTEALASLYGLLYRSVRRHRIPLQWARHVSVATTPLEARFFTGQEARLLVFLDWLARTRFGRVTRARLSDLRRQLRVRPAREEPDSS